MPKPALQTMILMGLMMAGARTIDALTANMLPITAKHSTNDLTLIGTMVALNRVGGFLIHPSAHIQSASCLIGLARARS